ncbi:hypothetical protein ACFUIY_14725 [Streptomyces griseorubiginosus]|uniref:hypothetical protein n=1 Tax=Streptomyces griseorubiginosus TaxID=67304 RepID=UPI003628773F
MRIGQAIANLGRSLKPGNDAELARTQYAGRESASERAASRTFGRPSRNAREADQQGQAWEEADRRRHGATAWYRGRR